MWQLNRTKDGWLVTLVNNRGVDKTQSGVARVDRRAVADVVVTTRLPVRMAKELTEPRELKATRTAERNEIPVPVHPGDVQVISIRTK